MTQPGERLTREEIASGEFHCHRVTEVLFEGASRFQKVEIVRTEGYGRGLFLDGRIQHVEADEYIYSESMIHPAMALLGTRARRILCIGGGPGGIIRELVKYRHVERIVQMEIDEEVLELSRKYLAHITRGAWDDARVEIMIGDALRLLEDRDEVFDLIVNDANEPTDGSPAIGLFRADGLALYQRRLHPEHGMFVTWAGSASPRCISRAARIVKTVSHVFPHTEYFLTYPQAYGTSWLTALGSMRAVDASRREPADIDAFLAENLTGELVLYDGLTHRHMFTLPRDVRRVLEMAHPPITRDQPLEFQVEVAR